MKTQVFNLGKLNTSVNPMLLNDGELIQSLNLDFTPFGGVSKRPGLVQHLGTVPTANFPVSLYNFVPGTLGNSAYKFFNYRQQGATLSQSTDGTGAWTASVGGTFPVNSSMFRYALLEDTVLVANQEGTVQSAVNGGSFSGLSGVPAPSDIIDYRERIYVAGYYNSFIFYSNVGTPTDFINDSTSVRIPGKGRILALYKSPDDKLVISKEGGEIYNWDGANLEKVSDRFGPTSKESLAQINGTYYYLNQYGVYRTGLGGVPEQISAPVEDLFIDRFGTPIASNFYGTTSGGAGGYKYYCTVGTAAGLSNFGTAIVYDTRLNNWSVYQSPFTFGAYLSFNEQTNNRIGSEIFMIQNNTPGTGASRTYNFSGTATTDSGFVINSIAETVFHAKTLQEKTWNYLWAHFNKGCQANIQVAVSNSFSNEDKNWLDIGDARTGVVEYKFPEGSRGRFLFMKVTDSSRNIPFTWYGYEVDFDFIDRK